MLLSADVCGRQVHWRGVQHRGFGTNNATQLSCELVQDLQISCKKIVWTRTHVVDSSEPGSMRLDMGSMQIAVYIVCP